MSDRPLTVEAPTTADPADTAVGETVPAVAPAPKPRTKRVKTEFEILGDIQDAFEALPSNPARHRVWEYVTSWLGETFPGPAGPEVIPLHPETRVEAELARRLAEMGGT